MASAPRVLAALTFFGILSLPPCVAGRHPQFTHLEYSLLPDYCKAALATEVEQPRMSTKRLPVMSLTQQRKWQNVVGPLWNSLPRYCHGVLMLSRAQNSTTLRRHGLSAAQAYASAIKDIEVAWSRSAPGALLWDKMTINYARALEGSGKVTDAVSLLQELVKQSAENPEVHVALARTLQRAGDINAAITTLESGLGTARQKGPLLFYLARYYYELGQTRKAAALVIQAEQAGMKMDRLRKRLESVLDSSTQN
ncbi:MAG: tetratricopeptide repeat protein [Thiohalocapsa sp. PB-PSB1]|nr:MAG: tetratricopeptide repeat protein [Thiohalocapsa sp. PB-PSB1]